MPIQVQEQGQQQQQAASQAEDLEHPRGRVAKLPALLQGRVAWMVGWPLAMYQGRMTRARMMGPACALRMIQGSVLSAWTSRCQSWCRPATMGCVSSVHTS
jgi:hypothetical protein